MSKEQLAIRERESGANSTAPNRLPNLDMLYHVPVYALREMLKHRVPGRRFSDLRHDELVAEVDKHPSVTEEDVSDLYENYRYGQSLAFYLFLLPTDLVQPSVESLQTVLDELAASELAELEGGRGSGEFEGEMPPGQIRLMDEERLNGIREIRFRYLVPYRFLNADEQPDRVLQTRYGFLWIDLALGYLSILSRDERLNHMLVRALSSCVQAMPLPVRFSKELVDEHFSIEKVRRVSHYDPGTGMRQSISGRGLWQSFEDEIVARERRYIRPSSLYDEEVADGIVSGLGITASKGKIYLTRTLTTSQVRLWGLGRLPDLVRDVQALRADRPEEFTQSIESINRIRVPAKGKAAIIAIAEGLLQARRQEISAVDLAISAHSIYDSLAGKYFDAYVRAECNACTELAELCPHCEGRDFDLDKLGVVCEGCGAALTDGDLVTLSCINGHNTTVAFDDAYSIAPNHWLQKRMARIFEEIGQTWKEKADYFYVEGRLLYWLQKSDADTEDLPAVIQNYINHYWSAGTSPVHAGVGDVVVDSDPQQSGSNGSGKAYHNFDLRLRGNLDVGYTIEAAASDGGSVPPQPLFLPADPSFGRQLKEILRQAPDEQNMRTVGSSLFESLFPTQIVKLWSRAKGKLDNGTGLRLRLRIDSPGLIKMPWELLYEDEYLGLRPRFPIVRYLDLPDSPVPLAVDPPLRVLVAVAQPKDQPRLDVKTELDSIQGALSQLADQVEVVVLPAARREQVLSKLRDGFHILHFIGHGAANTQEGYLALEDKNGRTDLISASLIGNLVADSNLRLVILNACKTSAVGLGSTTGGVAHQMVKAGMPAVIAMQAAISDQAAIAFSHDFYEALVKGWPVDAAIQEGRRGIVAALGNHWKERMDWAIPTLYMRAPDGQILKT
jgi:hypothetical protein